MLRPMVRVVATLLALVWVGTADAAPARRKVKITTEPEGAMVYLETVEDGPVCETTPCTVELPVGDNTVILELANHERLYEVVAVPRRGKVKDYQFKLVPAVGYVILDGPEGAELTIDDVDHGEAPTRAEVSPDAHRVVVTLDGTTLYDSYVEVPVGAEHLIELDAAGGGAGDDDEDVDLDGGRVTAKAKPRARAPFLRVSAALDVGFRAFRYRNVQTAQTLRDETERGQLLAGPIIELWPGVLAGIHALRGLSVLARYQYGLNKQEILATGLSGPTNTFWQSLELSVRHRWWFAERVSIEVGAGYVRDQLQFEGVAQDILRVPDADYQSLRLGVQAAMRFDKLEPYLAAENRIVTSGGKLAARFEDGTQTSGLRAAIGLAFRHGNLQAHLEGAWTRYSWDFAFEPDAMMRAEGASDSIRKIQLAVGYAY